VGRTTTTRPYCDLVISGPGGAASARGPDYRGQPPRARRLRGTTSAWTTLRYHGHTLTIFYDKSGEHYKRGNGLRILVDGKELAASEKLGRLMSKLP